MSNIKHINQLLDRYYSGESSRAEEAELKAFFCGSDVPEGMEADAALFRALDADVPASVAERIDSTLRMLENRSRRAFIRRITASAACIAIVLGVCFTFIPRRPAPVTPEQARVEVEAALTKLTSTVQKGCQSLNNL